MSETREGTGPKICNPDGHAGIVDPDEKEFTSGTPGYPDAAFEGIGRIHVFPKGIAADGKTTGRGLTDDKGFRAVATHVSKVSKESNAFSKKGA